MTAKVISVAGVPVEVATPGGSSDVPIATADTAGIVKATVPVADVETIPVTDISSTQQAIAAMGTTLSEVMQAMRNAGLMER